MELLEIIAKPIQAVKELFDLDAELETPSLATQFVAIKHELETIQEQLAESDRISREKDKVIAQLKKTEAAKGQAVGTRKVAELQKRLAEAGRALREKDEAIARLQQARTDGDGAVHARKAAELNKRLVESYQVAREKDERIAELEKQLATQASCKRPAPKLMFAEEQYAPAETTEPPQPSAQAGKPAGARKARPVRKRVAPTKADPQAKASGKPKRTRKAASAKTAQTEKAKPVRKRATAKKVAPTKTAQATAKTK